MSLLNPCPRNEHDLADESNVYTYQGRSMCKPCRARAARELRQRRKNGVEADSLHPMAVKAHLNRRQSSWLDDFAKSRRSK